MKLLVLFILSQIQQPPLPTADYVKILQPSMARQKLHQLAKVIDAAANRYNIESSLLAAIVRQESNFRDNLRQCNLATWKTASGQPRSRESCDYGIAQVNELWIGKWDLDRIRLQNDAGYNLMVAARILRLLKKYFADTEANWFGRYHSATPSHRAEYERHLIPILKKSEITPLPTSQP